ncbi:MAG: MarR family transcriptional regulator [Candidatus Kapabacteria bacterium]|nr:MarR family transcriptional regulator [Candidatus Kapabacteria bacterium]
MEFEKKIGQTRPFRNEKERAMVNILFTNAWLNDRMRDFMEQFGITRQQFNVLRILRGQHPNAISTNEIRTRMVDRAPDTSRIVDRMVQKQLVAKEVCSTDKRLVDVRITTKGLDLLKSIETNNIKIESFLDNLSNDEARSLNELLDKLKE